ncbi:DNA replication factor C, large subunit [Histomonas meleagridis]|uniref:DNA replication factor C, large subunit n=1 Tax=Histomonas meleagridis TaxID=135588 RepID=UPI00355986EA|nr:DNA replication factor C, large subunit [Histomonas meleagridis]KAH0804044.1 DNA replication factor C, large subunit [Histomonas meleagridis]
MTEQSPFGIESNPNHENIKRPKVENIGKVLLPPNIPNPSKNFSFIDKSKNSHTDAPPLYQQVPVPSGAEHCLQGLCFSATGTMRSLKRGDLRALIEKYGGRLRPSINANTDVLIRGVSDVNEEKYNQAKEKGITIIDENGLFYIIRQSNVTKKPIPEPSETTNEPPPKKTVKQAVDLLQLLNGKPASKPKKKAKQKTENEKPKPQETETKPKEIRKTTPTPVGPPPPEELSENEDSKYSLFTEKYRPKSFSDLVGNEAGIKKLREWIGSFDRQTKKAVLISGPPGIGKSSAAYLAATQANYNVIEYNASDARNKSIIEKLASDVTSNQTLIKYKTLIPSNVRSAIIFDEIDGMSSGDRGGVQALAKFISKTKIPIICICNDRNCDKLQSINKLVIDIPFDPPTQIEVAKRLLAICKQEGITLDRRQYIAITKITNGDIRSTINNLQLWANGIQNASEKDLTHNDPFKCISTLFNPQSTFDQKYDCFFVDYDMMPVLTHEYMYCNGNFHEYWEALDSMAYGNEIQNFIHESGNWELLPFRGVMSCVYPTTVSKNVLRVKVYSHFPEMLSKQTQQKKMERFISEASLRSSRSASLPRGVFRDSFAELITMKFYTLLSEKKENELMELLTQMELSKDDMENLRTVVDFGINSFPEVSSQAKSSFTKKYNQSHSQKVKVNDSGESYKADYYIKSCSQNSKRITRKSK